MAESFKALPHSLLCLESRSTVLDSPRVLHTPLRSAPQPGCMMSPQPYTLVLVHPRRRPVFLRAPDATAAAALTRAVRETAAAAHAALPDGVNLRKYCALLGLEEKCVRISLLLGPPS